MNVAKDKIIQDYLERFPVDAYSVLLKRNATDIAAVIEKYGSLETIDLLNLFPVFILSESLLKTDLVKVAPLIKLLDINLISRVLRKWKYDGHNEKFSELIESLDGPIKKNVETLISYREDSVGAIMNPAPFAVLPDLTVKEVLGVLANERSRYTRYIYIVDSSKKLLGVVPFKELFYASEKEVLISQLMANEPYTLSPHLKLSLAKKNSKWSKWNSLPIVNQENTFLGALKYEALEDYLGESNIESSDNSIDIAAQGFAEVLSVGAQGSLRLINAFLNTKDEK